MGGVFGICLSGWCSPLPPLPRSQFLDDSSAFCLRIDLTLRNSWEDSWEMYKKHIRLNLLHNLLCMYEQKIITPLAWKLVWKFCGDHEQPHPTKSIWKCCFCLWMKENSWDFPTVQFRTIRELYACDWGKVDSVRQNERPPGRFYWRHAIHMQKKETL